MKHALLAASLVLVGGSVVACGGDGGGGAPADASKADFCDAYTSLYEDLGELAGAGGETPDGDAMLETFQDWAKEMEDVGTPEDIPDDAREGFELVIDQVGDLKASDLDEAGLQDLDENLSADEKEQGEAFNTYLTDNCEDPLEELAPSDAPS